MTFRVGQKVVCIHTGRPPCGEVPPALGEIYTIRDLIDHGHGIGVRVVEIRNAPRHYGLYGFMECTFGVNCFKPLVERKTDISIFTSMLNPSKVDA